MPNRIVIASAVCLTVISCVVARAQSGADGSAERPTIVFAPPVVPAIVSNHDEDAQVNPDQILEQIIPRVAGDVVHKKWPLTVNLIESEAVFEEALGRRHRPDEDISVDETKRFAAASKGRFVAVVRVLSLTSRYYERGTSDNTFVRVTARAQIELTIFDAEVGKVVFRKERTEVTNHPDKRSKNVGLRREQDGAMNSAITQLLELFAKGERMTVAVPTPDLIATVSKVLPDGKVLIDLNRSQHVSAGLVFNSLETDVSIRVTDVLDNGSIAEVIKGTPRAGEVFKVSR